MLRLTSEDILDKVRKAFAPFHVVAQLQDYHRQLGFRVYAEHDEIVGTFEGNLMEDLRNPANLKQLLLDTRAIIEGRNKQLSPWSFES
jgi:hypothetical protein